MRTAFMRYPNIRGRRRDWRTVGRSLVNRLHSVMMCRAVWTSFSGQLQYGEDVLFILRR
jgi:hypothetical protein